VPLEFQLLLDIYFPPAFRLLALLLLIAWFWPLAGNRLFAAVERWGSRVAVHRATAIAIVAVLLGGVRFALLPVEPIPVPAVQDGFSYLLAGDTYAHLRLTNPPHALPIFFEAAHVNMLPTYMSKYPPAQGAALAVGEWLGHPWFGVLLCVAAMCAAITWMLQGWMPARWALLGGVLAAARFVAGSVYGMNYWLESYWGGAVAACGGALALGALPRLMRRGKIRDAILFGLGIAILANSRPYEGLVFCLPLAAALAWWLLRPDRPPGATARWRALAPVAAVLALTGAFMAYNNWRVTGNALLFPYVVNDRAYVSTPHFAWMKLEPPRPLSNPQMDAVFNRWCRTVWNRERFRFTWDGIHWGLLRKLDRFQEFYLPVGFLLPMALTWRRLLRSRKAQFLLAVCACTVLGLVPVVWFQPHYAAEMTGAAMGLSVLAMRYLRTWRPRGRPAGIGLTRALFAFHLLLVPMNILPIRLGRSIHTTCPMWACDRALIASELEKMPGQQLVLVRYAPGHNQNEQWVYNRADIDHAKVVWAQEVPGQDLQPLLDYFHGRKVWVVAVDSHPTILQAFTAARAP
jgi:hypothetical protein